MALSFYITWELYYCGRIHTRESVEEYCEIKRGLNVALKGTEDVETSMDVAQQTTILFFFHIFQFSEILLYR